MGLKELLARDRDEILRRFVAEVRGSDLTAAAATRPQLLDGIPRFLDEVVAAMASAPPPSMAEASERSVTTTASEHGQQRWALGYNVRELVREYGILRDVILGLLAEAREPIDMAEYRVFTRYISRGVAEAVGQFSDERDAAMARQAGEQFAFLAHELRGPLTVAMLSMDYWKYAPPTAASIADVEDSLRRLARLIDGTLVSERLRSGQVGVVPVLGEVDLASVAADVIRAIGPIAARREVGVRADIVPATLIVPGDLRLVTSALSNLVGNAVKFTRPNTTVLIRARIVDDAVKLDVEDACGGLPPGAGARMFEPFVQLSGDRTGFGLGLAITRQAVEAHGGQLAVEDRPGHGCRFTLTIPLHAAAGGAAPP